MSVFEPRFKRDGDYAPDMGAAPGSDEYLANQEQLNRQRTDYNARQQGLRNDRAARADAWARTQGQNRIWALQQSLARNMGMAQRQFGNMQASGRLAGNPHLAARMNPANQLAALRGSIPPPPVARSAAPPGGSSLPPGANGFPQFAPPNDPYATIRGALGGGGQFGIQPQNQPQVTNVRRY